jgi:hypothetical protein
MNLRSTEKKYFYFFDSSSIFCPPSASLFLSILTKLIPLLSVSIHSHGEATHLVKPETPREASIPAQWCSYNIIKVVLNKNKIIVIKGTFGNGTSAVRR